MCLTSFQRTSFKWDSDQGSGQYKSLWKTLLYNFWWVVGVVIMHKCCDYCHGFKYKGIHKILKDFEIMKSKLPPFFTVCVCMLCLKTGFFRQWITLVPLASMRFTLVSPKCQVVPLVCCCKAVHSAQIRLLHPDVFLDLLDSSTSNSLIISLFICLEYSKI